MRFLDTSNVQKSQIEDGLELRTPIRPSKKPIQNQFIYV
jgi:hypothetical protein